MSDHGEPAELRRVRAISRTLDAQFTFPNTKIRFGWDFIVGLIPGVGDALTTVVSLYIIAEAQRLGVSAFTLARMGLNVVVDAVLGSIPLVGDVFDVFWRSNLRNVRLLESAMVNPKRRSRIDAVFGVSVIVGIVLIVVGIVVAALYLIAKLIELVN